tara:strand:+ start:123 stop:329 length:207 start_codon:yes stop_codon:yes gene_type:complete
MKNKFNIGDNVVFFYDDFGTYEVSKEIVSDVKIIKNRIAYSLLESHGDVKEEELYTKEEAIEFLKGVL